MCIFFILYISLFSFFSSPDSSIKKSSQHLFIFCFFSRVFFLYTIFHKHNHPLTNFNVAHYSLLHSHHQPRKKNTSPTYHPQFIHKTDRRLNYSLSPFRWFGISKKKQEKEETFFIFLLPPTTPHTFLCYFFVLLPKPPHF